MGSRFSKKKDNKDQKTKSTGGRSGGSGKEASLKDRIINNSGIKLTLIGFVGVGKTCIVLRYVKNDFPGEGVTAPTIGASYLETEAESSLGPRKLEIWDTAGDDRFKSLAQLYYGDAQAVVVVYDITNISSYQDMGARINEVCSGGDPSKEPAVLAIVGNKCDKEAERKVPTASVQQYVDQLKATGRHVVFHECSAATGVGIKETFQDIINELITIAGVTASDLKGQ